MKKIFAILLSICVLSSCTSDIEEVSTGSIYGIVTESETAEPARSIGVELYMIKYDENYYGYSEDVLLLKTVTYDDGSYTFEDLTPGEYRLKIVASGYEETKYKVTVEAGRTARVDMQLVQLKDIGLKIVTENAEFDDKDYEGYVFLCGRFLYIDEDCAPIDFGVLYSKNSNPKNNGTRVVVSLDYGSLDYEDYISESEWIYFDCPVDNLSKGKYYFQAYATNKYGTIYGNVLSFEVK